MLIKILEGLYGFIWQDYRQNNCNAYLIDDGKKILIDPGHKHLFGHVVSGLDTLKIDLKDIDLVVITHGHPDHMEAITAFRNSTQFTMSEIDFQYIKELAGSFYKIPEPDFFLKPGDLTVGSLQFQVISTPGHTPGSICLYWPEHEVLFTGDVVFDQGIGRTDLPGGSSSELKESILKIQKLPVQYLLTGHGNIVTGKQAVQENFSTVENYWFRYL
ncbi:MAG: MBL fold metallo-hydrolase [Desulfomonilia bacterium]